MALGQGQEITLTFNTHIQSQTQLVVCIYQLSGLQQAVIVSEKSTVYTFSYRKAYATKFDLAVK